MTDFNKLADALENIAHMEYPSAHHDGNNLREAARILRAAGAADVVGLMHAADRYALSQSDPAHWRAALESALRVAMAPKAGFVMVPGPDKLDAQIHDSSETHVHAEVEAACWGDYMIEASRDNARSDWYITVTAPNGMRDYDGYWRNSAFKTADDVVNEAIRGACLMGIAA